MVTTTITGHPLHAMTTDLPVGNLTFSLAMDVMHQLTGKKSYDDAAYYSIVGGNIGAVAAAISGVGDYLAIPSGSPSKQTGNLHALLNIGVLSLYTGNMMVRRRQRARGQKTGLMPFLMSVLGITGLSFSTWYGGRLVYEHGMRVSGKSPVEGAPELKLPGDDRVTEAFSKLGEKVTAAGPVLGGAAKQKELTESTPPESESRQG